MAPTRMQKFRHKIKLEENAEELSAYNLKHNESNKKYKEQQLKDPKNAKIYRKKQADYMQNYRQKKFDESIENKSPNFVSQPDSFRSNSAKSKAINKVIKSLPKTLNKKIQVISSLADKFGVFPQPSTAKKKKPRKAFNEIELCVADFFASDHVTRSMPGVKDYVIMKTETGKKEKCQKRLLMMSCGDAHLQFLDEHPWLSISYSKFCDLRPKSVIPMKDAHHESCLCQYCENFSLKVDALAPYFQHFHPTTSDIMIKVHCHTENFDCASNVCEQCADPMPQLKSLLLSNCGDEQVELRQWCKNDKGYVQRARSDINTVDELLKEITRDLETFKLHRYLKQFQQSSFQFFKSNSSSSSAVMVVDFAEAYNAKTQNEIQSAFFARQMITLFTCCSYINNEPTTIVLASDDKGHDKEHVYVYIKKIVDLLKQRHPDLEHIDIYSDGACSQFKNYYTLSLVNFARDDFGITINWHFFATSHGKSAADGAGAVVKRGVGMRVLSGSNDVYNASEFVDCVKTFAVNTNILLVTAEDFTEELSFLRQRWQRIKPIPNVRKYHCFKPSDDPKSLFMAISSYGDNPKFFQNVK
jgi:hypothetical protein